MKLVKYLYEKSINIIMIQEHNIKSIAKIEYLMKYYNAILNQSILLKGGTLILIDKRLPAKVCRSYLHPSSRITTAVINIMGTELYLVNMYAPSGKKKQVEREQLFETELIYQLTTNTDNMLMGGDWNSVLVSKDTSKPASACYSKALKHIITSFKYKDIFSVNKRKPEYTYYQKNYAARLDRIYVNKLISSIQDTVTYPASLSDHLCVSVTLDLAPQIQVARPRWRLNVSLLNDNCRKENFLRIWSYLQDKIEMFPNIIQWWEEMAKPQIRKFYINQGIEK